MNRKVVVGFTGPIGSGCSTIAREFFRDIKEFKFGSLSKYIKTRVNEEIKDRKPNALVHHSLNSV